MEELRVGAVSHGEEWLRSALSEILRDELRPLAAAGGVETRPDNKWLQSCRMGVFVFFCGGTVLDAVGG